MDIEFLIHQHQNWKNLVESLFNEEDSSILNPVALSKDNECELGHWIRSKEARPFLFDDSYSNLIDLHTDFHYLAGKIVFEFQAGKVTEAKKLIPQFSDISEKLILTLEKLKS